jgi:sec-independent protein translocase protein TatA
MAPTWFKLLLVIAIVVVLFGRGRISDMMGDFAKGIKSFKNGLKDDDAQAAAPRSVDQDAATARLGASLADRDTARAG